MSQSHENTETRTTIEPLKSSQTQPHSRHRSPPPKSNNAISNQLNSQIPSFAQNISHQNNNNNSNNHLNNHNNLSQNQTPTKHQSRFQSQSSSQSQSNHFRPPNPSIWNLIFNNEWNLQFSSSRGLARHMFGGYFLGFTLSFGIFLFIISMFYNNNNNNEMTLMNAMIPFSLYIIFSTSCYTLEYTWHAIFHPETLDFDAFILYSHSRAFHVALLAAFVEYFLEYFFFPNMKHFSYIQFIGIIIILFGQTFRSLAQFTAGMNFTHLIATEKRDSHQLVTNGVYSISRHPSYFGWFWWSVGTQILLANPICTIAYAFASWNFFHERIPYEEAYLIRFFGQDYVDYKNRTPIGIPFLK